MGVTRRELLEALGVLGGGLLAARLGGGAEASELRPWPWSARGYASARALGAEYLRRFPEERPALLRLRATTAAGHGGGQQSLGLRMRRDFERGDVVQLRGWVLSRTEARLCGAAAVTP